MEDQHDTDRESPTANIQQQRRPALALALIAAAVVAVVVGYSLVKLGAPEQPPRDDGVASGSAAQGGGSPVEPSSPSAVNTEPSQATTLTLTEEGFSPSTLTIATNVAVTWKNGTGENRAIGRPDGEAGGPRSPQLPPGASFTYSFPTAGTYRYIDITRPEISGEVIVKKP